MKITITPKAHQWFTHELNLEAGDTIRFFGKYGGSTNVHNGFSTGMEVGESPIHPLVSLTQDNITYYIEANDDWFFSPYNLLVDYDQTKDEPTYTFTEEA